MEYQLIRSRKRYRSMALQIKPTGELIVSVPWYVAQGVVDKFVESKSGWITRKLKQLPQEVISVSPGQKKECIKNALAVFQNRVVYFSNLMQLKPTELTVSRARTRWGSCTHNNRIRLNWRLLLLPQEVLDAVVIHELAHIRHKNHSKLFWNLVAQFDPQFKTHRLELKRHSYLLSL